MEYKEDQDIDFVERTKKIVEQYENHKESHGLEHYDITLLMNSFVGLLVIPKEVCLKQLNKEKSLDSWSVKPESLNKWEGTEKKTLGNVVRHLRNSVVHYRFKFNSEQGEITSVRFKDCKKTKVRCNACKKTNDCVFDATLEVNDIRVFTLKLADYFIENKKK